VKALLLWVRYDGTNFHGWQVQKPGTRTVQGELTRCLETMLGQDFRLATSSRTDAGVHAMRHPVVLETESTIPAPGLLRGLNALTPPDLSVVGYHHVSQGFGSRKSALAKTYVYRVFESRIPDPFLDRQAWRVRDRVDLLAMRRAARCFIGEHDFDAFRSAHCDAPTTRRFINAMGVYRLDGLVQIVVTGNAFLRNMVRVMAGTLVEVGRHRLEPDDIAAILANRDRAQAGITAPARGLTLLDIHYPPEVLCYGACGW
jgi:tRNA pseudouridine38-40 synthase